MFSLIAVAFAAVGLVVTNAGDQHVSTCTLGNATVFDYNVETLSNNNESLRDYRGNVLLIVNVATFCGYTEQYLDFNLLAKRYSDRGLQMLLFPCNQFGLQEPASNSEIMNGLRYVRPGNEWIPHAAVHIFGKLKVNGDGAHPLFEALRRACPATTDMLGKRENMYWNPLRTTDIVWNFEKFLVDHTGRPRYRFHPADWDHGAVLVPYIERLLSDKAMGMQNESGQALPLANSAGTSQHTPYKQFMRFVNGIKVIQT